MSCGDKHSGPICSKRLKLNEHIKRSPRLVFYHFITKYPDILVEKMREASHIFFNKTISIN